MGGRSLHFTLETLPVHLREQAARKIAGAGGGRAKQAETPTERATKYKAKRLRANGLLFDSKYEYRKYLECVAREAAGEIAGLRCQVRFSLFDPGENCRGEHIGTYRADFVFREKGKLVVADAKSEYTRKLRDWARTKKLMRACHGIEVREL